MPSFTINTLVYVSSAIILSLAVVVFVVLKVSPPSPPGGTTPKLPPTEPLAETTPLAAYRFSNIRHAFAIVFLASFCGMTLELTASRLIAQHLGVSLFTWTGIIGVMLAGTALGNLSGGILADRANRPGGAGPPPQRPGQAGPQARLHAGGPCGDHPAGHHRVSALL